MAKILTDVQKEKYDFCETELSTLISKALSYDIKAFYYVNDYGDELVDLIRRKDGVIIRTVNVSMDSLIALTRDVIKKL